MTIINNTYQATVTASHHSTGILTHQVGYLVFMDTFCSRYHYGYFYYVDKETKAQERPWKILVSAGDCRRLASSNWHCSPPSHGIRQHCSLSPKLDPDLDGYDVMYYLGIICFRFIMHIFILHKLYILHLLHSSYT